MQYLNKIPLLNKKLFPLHVAAEEGNLERVMQLIDKGSSINKRDGNGMTPLHFAARNERLNVVEYLVSRNCDVDVRDRLKKTPLADAAWSLNVDMVLLLLRSGADFHFCSDFEEVDCHRILLHRPPFCGNLDILRLVLESGKVDFNLKDHDGSTPLMSAAFCVSPDCVKVLLDRGADCLLRDNHGLTAIHQLCRRVFGPALIHQFCFVAFGKPVSSPNFEDFINRKLESIRCLVDHGSYFEAADYKKILECQSFTEKLLSDEALCTRSLINKFNNFDLPAVYSILESCAQLPSVGSLKIHDSQKVAYDIAQCVKEEIQSRAFCNVLEIKPTVLKLLSVRSLFEYYQVPLNGI